MKSPLLPKILHHWWKPPHSSTAHSWKRAAEGGRPTLTKFMVEIWPTVLTEELEGLRAFFLSPSDNEEDVAENTLTSWDLPKIIEMIQDQAAPNLWKTLWALAYTSHQDKKNQRKNPDTIQQAIGMKNPITLSNIFLLSFDAKKRLWPYITHRVLSFILEVPEFDLSTYSDQTSSELQPPQSIHKLPHGKENATLQFLLGSVNIPEASYEDPSPNYRVPSSGECGDQLTIDRLWGLFHYRARDSNSFEQLDWMLLVFGWFHLQMAFAQSLHKQYLGTAKGQGLRKSFNVMKRKGLLTTSIRGPFHHHLDEALKHIAEARIRIDLCSLANVDSISQLRNKSPDELLALAETFGGGNSKYAMEVLELLQALHQEWPEEVKNFVQEHCWMLNMSGKPDAYVSVDQMQEHNIKDIKDKIVLVTYRSDGPNIKWEYLKKLHPAIPIIHSLSEHMEKQFRTLTRGKWHTIPKKEKDVQKLEKLFQDSKYHTFMPGRKLKAGKDKAKDFIAKGVLKLWEGNTLSNWMNNQTFECSTEEDWEDVESGDEAEGS
ncbi:hypothetical protein ARMSODRAFT_1016752 [Armillaria solidipes]|uniref:DUF6589 domain-containing protein n=1 Tax=Armillaria solidipes TaxID=1076256 RepID=A0A2H3BXQ9_9AGAR|nr:hypothetical protein ARMSODRAFT_1016752 [Armillaria solidipes]